MSNQNQVVIEFIAQNKQFTQAMVQGQKELQGFVKTAAGLLQSADKAQLAAGKSLAKTIQETSKATAAQAKYQAEAAKTAGVILKTGAAHDNASTAVKKHTESYNSLSHQLSSTIKQMVGLYVSINAVKTILTDGVGFNKFVEESTTAFGVMMKSTSAAEAQMKSLYNFAVNSPLTFKETVAASKQLMAYGFAASELVPTMKTLGTVAKAVNISLDDMSYIYGTLRSQGRAYTRDLMQFAMRGIPIYEELAKVMGVSTQEIQKLTESGAIGFAEVEKAFINMTTGTGKFAGFMEEFMKTFAGQASMLQDIWQKATGVLTKKVFDVLKVSMRQLISVLNRPEFARTLIELGDSMGKMAAGLAEVGIGLVKNIPLFVKLTKAIITTVAAMALLKGMKWVLVGLPEIVFAAALAVEGLAAKTLVLGNLTASIQLLGTAFVGLASKIGAAAVAGAPLLALIAALAGIVVLPAVLGNIGEDDRKQEITARGDTGAGLQADQLERLVRTYGTLNVAESSRIRDLQAAIPLIKDQVLKLERIRELETLLETDQERHIDNVRLIGQQYGLAAAQVLDILEAQQLITYEMNMQLRLKMGLTGNGATAGPGYDNPKEYAKTPNQAMAMAEIFRKLTKMDDTAIIYTMFERSTDSATLGAMKMGAAAAKAYIDSVQTTMGKTEAFLYSTRNVSDANDAVIKMYQDQIDSTVGILEGMYSAEYGKAIEKGFEGSLELWSKSAGQAFNDDANVAALKAFMADLEKKIAAFGIKVEKVKVIISKFSDAFKKLSAPPSAVEWDKWATVMGDIAADTRITDFYKDYLGFVDTAKTSPVLDASATQSWQDSVMAAEAAVYRAAMEMNKWEDMNWQERAIYSVEGYTYRLQGYVDTYRKALDTLSQTRGAAPVIGMDSVPKEIADGVTRGYNMSIPAQAEAYAEYIKAKEAMDIEYMAAEAKARKEYMDAGYSSGKTIQIKIDKKLAGLRDDMTKRSALLKFNLEKKQHDINIENLRKQARIMQEGDQAEYSKRYEARIGQGGIGNIAAGTAMQATEGTEMGKVMAGGDPLAMIIKALADFAMSIENVNKILNPIATVLEAMRSILEPLINGILQPTVDMLEMFGEIVAKILAPFLTLLQVAEAVFYMIQALDPLSISLHILGEAFFWFNNVVMVPVGNAIIKVFNTIITETNKIFKTNIRLLDYINAALTQAEKDLQEERLKKEATLVANTLAWLSDKMKKEISSQMNSWQDLWEVGAISTTKYMDEVAKLNQYSTSTQDEMLLLDAARLQTLADMNVILQSLVAVQKKIDAGEKYSLNEVTGLWNSAMGVSTTYMGSFSTATQAAIDAMLSIPAMISNMIYGTTATGAPGDHGSAAGIGSSGIFPSIPSGISAMLPHLPTTGTSMPGLAESGGVLPAIPGPGKGIFSGSYLDSVRNGTASVDGARGAGQSGENAIYVTVNVSGSVSTEKELVKAVAEGLYQGRKRGTISGI